MRIALFAGAGVIDAIVLAAGGFDANNLVQLLTVALIVAAALPVLRSRQKDATIDTLKDSSAARLERIHDLEGELKGAEQRANAEHEQRRNCERQVSKLEGQVEELTRYTSKEAFELIVGELASMRTTIGESISSQGELILKNTELQAQAVKSLERVVRDLDSLLERFADDGDT